MHTIKSNQTTFMQKKADAKHDWITVDAADRILGQVASDIAMKLMGKNKPTYTPHIDGGDFVIVVNASQIAVSGNKLLNKIYYRYSGFPGGLKQQNLGELLAKHPERVIEEAVKRMLPDNRLRGPRMARLKVYAGAAHPHQSQVKAPSVEVTA